MAKITISLSRNSPISATEIRLYLQRHVANKTLSQRHLQRVVDWMKDNPMKFQEMVAMAPTSNVAAFRLVKRLTGDELPSLPRGAKKEEDKPAAKAHAKAKAKPKASADGPWSNQKKGTVIAAELKKWSQYCRDEKLSREILMAGKELLERRVEQMADGKSKYDLSPDKTYNAVTAGKKK